MATEADIWSLLGLSMNDTRVEQKVTTGPRMSHFWFNAKDNGHLIKRHSKHLAKFLDEREMKNLPTFLKEDTGEIVVSTNDQGVADGYLHVDNGDKNSLVIHDLRTANAALQPPLLQQAVKIAIRRGRSSVVYSPPDGADVSSPGADISSFPSALFRFRNGAWRRNTGAELVELDSLLALRRALAVSEMVDCVCDCECVQATRAETALQSPALEATVYGLFCGGRMVAYAVVSKADDGDWIVWAFYVFCSMRKMGMGTAMIDRLQSKLQHPVDSPTRLIMLVCCPCCCEGFYTSRGFVKQQQLPGSTAATAAAFALDAKATCAFARHIYVPSDRFYLQTYAAGKCDRKTLDSIGDFIFFCVKSSGVETSRLESGRNYSEFIRSEPGAVINVVMLGAERAAVCVHSVRTGKVHVTDYESELDTERIYVLELFVHPGFQNMKLGTRLLAVAHRSSPRLPMHLHVESDNYRAQHFYAKYGFVLTTHTHESRHYEMICRAPLISTSPAFSRPPPLLM